MKAIVHIGAPKTATSSIQSFLHDNRDALARRGVRFHRNVRARGSQWEYPLAVLAQNGRLPSGGTERARYRARSLGEALATAGPFLRDLPAFAARWPEPVALFSSEHILPWMDTPDLVRAFDTAFSSAFSEVRYLVYFRDPANALLSQYSERIKRGATVTLSEFARRRVHALDLLGPARRWTAAVGRDRLDIRLFDFATLKGGDILTDFCAACAMDPAALIRPPRENPALTAPAAECLRILNSMVPELRPDGGPNPLRAEVLETVQAMSADMPPLRLNTKQRHFLRTHLDVSNEAFRREFFPERPVLFPQPLEEADVLPLRDIREMALDLMARLFIKTRMGEMRSLNLFERQRAHLVDATIETANTAGAPIPVADREHARARTK